MFLLTFIIFLLFPSHIQAIDEFSINQKTYYQIDSSLNTQVKQKVDLNNNLSEIYPKQYTVTLSGSDVSQISASDYLGNILKNVDQKSSQTVLQLQFNQPKMGKNQINSFEINYKANDLVTQKGNTWEITLPQYQSSQTKIDSQIEITLPSSFGKLSFSSVKNVHVDYFSNNTLIKINDASSQKILLIFGNYQLFDFELTYYLENSSPDLIKTEIALPPQTSNQSIIFRSLDPLPENIHLDQDGNWLAQYLIPANQTIKVFAFGQTKIFPQSSKPETIQPELFTKSQTYWPVTDSLIQKISQNLNTPKQIYDYVINTLSYDYDNFSSATRQGALIALQNPTNAVCTEFTDLFVTLARAKGIPAREIEGYAYTNNTKLKPINVDTDILHAWPQYYDFATESWKSIDPTWEKTTNGIDYFNDLDLNHLTFVIHGLDSQYPSPPGSYKNNQHIKTVVVDFAKTELEYEYQPPTIKFVNDHPFHSSKLKVFNLNPHSLDNIQITSSQISLDQTISQIPPYSYQEIKISQIPIPQIFLPQNQKIKFEIQYNNLTQPIIINQKYPPYFLYLITLLSLTIIILCFVGIIVTTHKKNDQKNI